MTKDYASYTREELVEFNKENYCQAFEWYTNTQNGNTYRDDKIRRFETSVPDPLWNGVLSSNHNEDEMEETIEEQLQYYNSKEKQGMMWYTYQSTKPANINQALDSKGFKPLGNPTPLMSCNLTNLPETKPVPGLEIKPVRSEEDLEIFFEVIGSRWDLGDRVFDMKREVECRYGFGEDCSRQMYIGYLDGVPVSSNFLIYDDDVVGLYKIATLPEYGRRGIGTALTLKPLFDARKRGYNIAILQSSPMGYRVYERLGFREDGQSGWYMYTWADQVKTM